MEAFIRPKEEQKNVHTFNWLEMASNSGWKPQEG